MDIVLGGAVIFVLLFVITRTIGRRELGQMEPFDLILQGVTQSDDSLAGTVLAVCTLAVLTTSPWPCSRPAAGSASSHGRRRAPCPSEVNATFSRLPRPATVEDWARRTPDDFVAGAYSAWPTPIRLPSLSRNQAARSPAPPLLG